MCQPFGEICCLHLVSQTRNQQECSKQVKLQIENQVWFRTEWIYGRASGSVTIVHKRAQKEPIATQEKGEEKVALGNYY
jgi:hypothetical protein